MTHQPVGIDLMILRERRGTRQRDEKNDDELARVDGQGAIRASSYRRDERS